VEQFLQETVSVQHKITKKLSTSKLRQNAF